MKKYNTNIFIEKARKVWGDLFDYSLVDYKNSSTHVKIICKKHGVFSQQPYHHLAGHGCPICKSEKRKHVLYGVAINDLINQSRTKPYKIWNEMIRRCYGCTDNAKKYDFCKIDDSWLIFSNFKKWYEDNYIEGYEMDKDLLFSEELIYSPKTCVFIPKELNTALRWYNTVNKETPNGIDFHKANNKYRVRIRNNILNKTEFLGEFESISKSFDVYRNRKKELLVEYAKKFFDEGKISSYIYNKVKDYLVRNVLVFDDKIVIDGKCIKSKEIK